MIHKLERGYNLKLLEMQVISKRLNDQLLMKMTRETENDRSVFVSLFLSRFLIV